MNIRIFPTLTLAVSLIACSAQVERTEHSQKQSSNDKNSTFQLEHASVSPGHCRIIGTLMSVDSTLEQSGPCSKVPCRGLVRVDLVLGYGSAFPQPVAVHSEIWVRFMFTVGPTTRELFPNLTQRLPGVQIHKSIETDIEVRDAMGSDQHNPTYLVEAYKVLN